MAKSLDGRMRRVEVKSRITGELYERLCIELEFCGCSVSGFLALAIAREIANRKRTRALSAEVEILEGQMDIEGKVHA